MVRQTDRDRAVLVELAPLEQRPFCSAIVALDLEITRISAVAKEPLLAQIRLTWWRDTWAETVADGNYRHPVLHSICQHTKSLDRLDADIRAYLDAQYAALGKPPVTEDELLSQAQALGGGICRMQAQACGGDAAAAETIGTAWYLVNYLADGVERRGKPLGADISENSLLGRDDGEKAHDVARLSGRVGALLTREAGTGREISLLRGYRRLSRLYMHRLNKNSVQRTFGRGRARDILWLLAALGPKVGF